MKNKDNDAPTGAAAAFALIATFSCLVGVALGYILAVLLRVIR